MPENGRYGIYEEIDADEYNMHPADPFIEAHIEILKKKILEQFKTPPIKILDETISLRPNWPEWAHKADRQLGSVSWEANFVFDEGESLDENSENG